MRLVKQLAYKNNRYDLPSSKGGETTSAGGGGAQLDEVPVKLTVSAQKSIAALLDQKREEVRARCSANFTS